jgi:hypothetical protein
MENFFTEKQMQNITFFDENLEKYVDDPLLANKYVLIHDEKLINAFDNFENALEYAVKNLPKNEYIIQRVIKSTEIINFIKAAVY